jgi:hypothetical protein
VNRAFTIFKNARNSTFATSTPHQSGSGLLLNIFIGFLLQHLFDKWGRHWEKKIPKLTFSCPNQFPARAAARLKPVSWLRHGSVLGGMLKVYLRNPTDCVVLQNIGLIRQIRQIHAVWGKFMPYGANSCCMGQIHLICCVRFDKNVGLCKYPFCEWS